jgi:hypothetical protein
MGVYTRSIAKITSVDETTLRIETRSTAPLPMQDLANVPML